MTHDLTYRGPVPRPARPRLSSTSARVAAGGAALMAAPAALLGAGPLVLAGLAAAGAGALVCYAFGLISPGRGSGLERGASGWTQLDALPDGFAAGDESGHLFRCNGAFLSLLGLERPPAHVGELEPLAREVPETAYRLLRALKTQVWAAADLQKGTIQARPDSALRIAVHVTSEQTGFAGSRGRAVLWQISPLRSAAAAGPAERPQGLAVQLLLDALPLAALLFDARGQVIASNSRLKFLAGLSEKDRVAGPITNLLLREDGEPFRGPQWRAFLRRPGEKAVRLKRGSLPGERMRAFCSETRKDSDVHQGWTLCVLAPCTPVAGSGETSVTDLLAAAPIAIASVKPDGAVVSVNPAFSRMFASHGADGERRNIGDFVDPSSRDALMAALDLAAGRDVHAAEQSISITVKFGPEARRSGQLFIGPGASPQSLILYGIETTEQHALEEQVSHSQKMQAMGQLAGGIAHDFNNVLTAIIGFSDLLLARFRPSDPSFRDIINIKNNANRAADLVRHLLAYSRRQTLRPRVLSLTDVIEDFNSSLGRLIGEKVKARIVHGRDLWLVKADESQLFQVIMNLSVNARDAMPDGGLLTIRTANISERESIALAERGIERGEYVLWEVSDTGTGIPPKHLKKIFDPFFSTKEVGKGTGLGLSLVDGIIRQTGGSILVDSKLGEGTTFRIYLPRHQESEQEAAAEQGSRKSPEPAADLTGSGTVLLVEDEDAVRSFASRALAARGYTVLEASSGVEALEVMEQANGEIDLVVSDVVMPEMDGPTLLSHLRKKKPGIKIVFMSGYAEEAFRKNLSADEKFTFLPKPFTLKKLAETIKQASAG